MPLQATSGAASYDAFGGGVAAVPTYIEDIFGTFLYTGNGSTQTINNGIDLSTKGGLVWLKSRSGADPHELTNTIQGISNSLRSNSTNGSSATDLTGFTSSGFTLGNITGNTNSSGATEVSWTFRKQPKFFDVVTYTGNDAASRQIAHNLGSTPGCVIVKATNNTLDWFVSHRSLATANAYLNLNTTAASATGQNWGNSGGTRPTSTDFTVGDNTNISGTTYVALLFAHNAGGFGLTGTDNVISCGSFTGSINGFVDLGFEPQWVLVKKSSGVEDWQLFDNMRGMTMGDDSMLNPNTSGAENNSSGNNYLNPQPTGFTQIGFGSGTFIYIAIRRGPMKVPTSGTSVFSPNATTSSTGTAITTNFPVDLYVWQNRDGTYSNVWQDRLRGIPDTDTTGVTLTSRSTLAEQSGGYNGAYQPWNTGLRINSGASGANSIYWNFRRAPSFFDEVCYTGNNVSGRAITHNLAAVPELMIVKSRTSSTRDWMVYDATNGATKAMNLNNDSVTSSSSVWASTAPTSTVFTVSDSSSVNDPAQNYVAYLFATCAGVSKVGSYTGNGSSQTINCGFTGGARFVMIKATSTTGNWIVADSARGIVAGNDPALYLNSTAAEVTGLDWIDADNSGFVVNETATIAANTNGVSYIFLAIA